MARQFKYVAAVVDRSGFQPLLIEHNVLVAADVGLRASADNLRDKMRKAYNQNVYGSGNVSKYQQNPDYTRTDNLSQFIVTRPFQGGYEVGAKKSQIVGRQYVSEIFAFMDQGTDGGGEPWTFRLTGKRASNTEDQFLTTYGQEPKEFMEPVARSYGISDFHLDQVRYTKNAVNIALKASGYKMRTYLPKGGIKL